eukprot:TRINITY_DN2224_c1_g2_i1.p1 TRINITY_DN2224_c1_g2~~TRINITY_DN2224_c1_g2_i1.p1  ORF type:complete len:1026 (+),score=279.61 TRINITY_DN2224_c1_g2_i1:97-3174(+)
MGDGLAAARPTAWVPDDHSKLCSNCGREFSLLLRRHHCRACGELCCAPCSATQMLIPGYSSPERVCNRCRKAYLEGRDPKPSASEAAPVTPVASASGDDRAAFIERLGAASRRFRSEFPSYEFCQWAAPVLSHGAEVGVLFPEEALPAMRLLGAVGDCAKDSPYVLKTLRKQYAEEAFVHRDGGVNGQLESNAGRKSSTASCQTLPDKLSSTIRGVYQETAVMAFDLTKGIGAGGVTYGRFVGTMVLNTKGNEELKRSLLSTSLTRLYRNGQQRCGVPDVVIGRHGRVDTATKTQMLVAMVNEAVRGRAPSRSSGKKRVRFCSMLNALSIQKDELKYFKLQLQWLQGELSPYAGHSGCSGDLATPLAIPQGSFTAADLPLPCTPLGGDRDIPDDVSQDDGEQMNPHLIERIRQATSAFPEAPDFALGDRAPTVPVVNPEEAVLSISNSSTSGATAPVPFHAPPGRPRAMATSPMLGGSLPRLSSKQSSIMGTSVGSVPGGSISTIPCHVADGGAVDGGTQSLEKAINAIFGEESCYSHLGSTQLTARTGPETNSSGSASLPASPTSPTSLAQTGRDSHGYFPAQMRDMDVEYSFLNYVANWPLSLRLGANQHDRQHNSRHRLGLRQHLKWLLEEVLFELQSLPSPVVIPPAVLSLKGVRAALHVLIDELQPGPDDGASPSPTPPGQPLPGGRKVSLVDTEDDPDEKDAGDKPATGTPTPNASLDPASAGPAVHHIDPEREEVLTQKRKRCSELFMALRLIEELLAGKGSTFRRRAAEFLQLCLVEHILNVTPFFNCKSGIDRTGVVCSLWSSVQQLLLSPSRPVPVWLMYYLALNYHVVIKTLKGVHYCGEPGSDGAPQIPRAQLDESLFADASTLLPFPAGGSDDPSELRMYAHVEELQSRLGQSGCQTHGVEARAYALLKALFFKESHAIVPVLQTAFLCNLLGTSAKIAAHSTGVHGFKYGESGLPGSHNALCAQYLPSVCLFPNNKALELTTVRRAFLGTEVVLSKEFQHYLVAAASARGT